MTLKDCTKDELIFVIKQLQFHCLDTTDYYLQCALTDVECMRNKQRLEEAMRLLDYAYKKLKERDDLLAPYDGCRYVDIPDDVMRRAVAAEKEYNSATTEWNKLMGIQ